MGPKGTMVEGGAGQLELRSDRLRVLVEVVRSGGFSRAARVLGTTQSSVSQSVAALEQDVGEQLLVRGRREVVATEAGRALLAGAEKVLAALEEARDALRSMREVTAGTVALGTSDTLATYLLAPVFAAFRSRYPQVSLRLENRPSPVIAALVARRELDLGIVTLPLPDSAEPGVGALKQVPLRTVRDVAIVRPGHPLARRTRLSPAALAAEPLLLLDRTTATRAFLERHFEAAGLHPRVAMEMSSVEVLKRMVELGFGVSVVPEVACRREVSEGTLVALPLAGWSGRRQVGLLQRPEGVLSKAGQALAQVARELLGKARE